MDLKRIVIKVGTTTLTYSSGRMNLRTVDKLAWVIADLKNSGIDVVLVSSGAIAVGAARIGLEERPRDTIGKQASSAVGQAVLMQIYEKSFMEYNRKVAQILLTKDVFDYESKRRNAKNTINRLLEMGVVPIVNENDTVAIDELQEFSDNDTLSAYVSNLIEADLLILLSDIDGLYTADPNKDPDARIIDCVESIDESIYSIAGDSASSFGTGGMITKIRAAGLVNKNKADLVIASGADPKIIFDIMNGENIGTLFVAEK